MSTQLIVSTQSIITTVAKAKTLKHSLRPGNSWVTYKRTKASPGFPAPTASSPPPHPHCPPNPHAYLLYMKPMKLVCNALKLSGDLYLCPMLPLSFRGLLPKGQACRETGRERKPVAGIACKDRGSTSQHFLPYPTVSIVNPFWPRPGVAGKS